MEDIWKYAAGGALIGILGMLAGFWGKIKGVLWRVVNLFVQRVEIPTEAAHEALVAYLIAHYKRSRQLRPHVRRLVRAPADGRYGLVPYESSAPAAHLLERLVPVPLHQRRSRARPPAARATSELVRAAATKVYSTLTFIRGTLDVEKILRDACDGAQPTVLGGRATEETGQEPLLHPPRPASAASEDDDWTTAQQRPGVVPAGQLPAAGAHAGPARQGAARTTAGRSTT